MTNNLVLILIEHVQRELDITCLLKVLLEKQLKCKIEVRSLADLSLRRLVQNPQVVVVPFFSSLGDWRIADFVNRYPNATFVNLGYECMLFAGSERFKSPKDLYTRSSVYHLAGSKSFERLLLKGKADKRMVEFIGNISCTLYKSPYSSYFQIPKKELASQFNLDPCKRWIFFPENFAAAFFDRRLIQSRIEAGYKPIDLHDYQTFARTALHEIAGWLDSVRDIGNAEIVIRPRPAMDPHLLEQTLITIMGNKLPSNLHIIKNLTARQWILSSEVTVSTYSTCLVEASVAKKPVAMLSPADPPACMNFDWLEMCPRIRSADQFRSLVEGNFGIADGTQLSTWANRELFASEDCFSLVTRGIHRILSTVGAPSQVPVTRREANYPLYRRLLFASRTLRHSLFLPTQEDFSENQIIERCDRWRQVLSCREPLTTE